MMTQTQPGGKGTPTITVTKDGSGWWRYEASLDNEVIFSGFCRGKRADAVRDAEYRLKPGRASHG